MHLDQNLVDAAAELLDRRLPGVDHAVAAAVYLDEGQILTSVSLDNINAAAGLCAETGALCQAYTLDKAVTASVCVVRTPHQSIDILAPCGICQERLALWGPSVQVAVGDGTRPEGWAMRTLAELNPYYWATHYTDGHRWPTGAEHS